MDWTSWVVIIALLIVLFLYFIPRFGIIGVVIVGLIGILIFAFTSIGSDFSSLSSIRNTETGLYSADMSLHWWTEEGLPHIEIVGITSRVEKKYDTSSIGEGVEGITTFRKDIIYMLNFFVDGTYIRTESLYEVSGVKSFRIENLQPSEYAFVVEILEVGSNEKDTDEMSEVIG